MKTTNKKMHNHKDEFEHYFSKRPKSEFKLYEINVDLDISFKIYSASGIFSKKKLDLGTRVLIENLMYQPNWTVLDFGCGNGIIGVYLKLKEPTLKVYAVDINKRAVAITKKNIQKYNFKDFVVINASNLDYFKRNKIMFDAIYLNPPMTAGLEIVGKMFKEAKEVLKEDGIFQVVVRTRKGGNKIKEMLMQHFGNVNVVGKGSGFRVYLSKKIQEKI